MDEFQTHLVSQCLAEFGKDLLGELISFGKLQSFGPDEYVVKQGQLVRSLPILISGTVKVYSEEDGLPFLLYYINPGSTCIFSFAHLFNEKEVSFSGITEEESLLLLVPIYKAREWLLKYPAFSEMILHEYQKHYNDLLETTKQVICYNLEDRLLQYLKTKANIAKSAELTITHQHIAADLATSREVISWLLKKMEKDQKILQVGRRIKLTLPRD